MNDILNEFGFVLVSSGGMSSLTLEAIKWLIIWIKKDANFQLPIKLIVILLPILNFLWQPALAWLGAGEYSLPADWIEWLRTLAVLALSSVVSVLIYNLGLDSLNTAARERLNGK